MPLLELDASSMMIGASITASAGEPAVTAVVNAKKAASVIGDFISSPQVVLIRKCHVEPRFPQALLDFHDNRS